MPTRLEERKQAGTWIQLLYLLLLQRYQIVGTHVLPVSIYRVRKPTSRDFFTTRTRGNPPPREPLSQPQQHNSPYDTTRKTTGSTLKHAEWSHALLLCIMYTILHLSQAIERVCPHTKSCVSRNLPRRSFTPPCRPSLGSPEAVSPKSKAAASPCLHRPSRHIPPTDGTNHQIPQPRSTLRMLDGGVERNIHPRARTTLM